jgi:hypothetical protein
MSFIFELVWPFTSKLKFCFCTVMLIPILIMLGPALQTVAATMPANGPDKESEQLLMLLKAAPLVPLSQHAIAGHPEAEKIDKCLKTNGADGIFRSIYDKSTFYFTCHLPDGKWGLAAYALVKGTEIVNKTAFCRGDGSYQEMMKYLNGIATRFNGKLP